MSAGSIELYRLETPGTVGQIKNFHPCLLSKARLNPCNFLNPNPPTDLGLQSLSHLIQLIPLPPLPVLPPKRTEHIFNFVTHS